MSTWDDRGIARVCGKWWQIFPANRRWERKRSLLIRAWAIFLFLTCHQSITPRNFLVVPTPTPRRVKKKDSSFCWYRCFQGFHRDRYPSPRSFHLDPRNCCYYCCCCCRCWYCRRYRCFRCSVGRFATSSSSSSLSWWVDCKFGESKIRVFVFWRQSWFRWRRNFR